MTRAGAAKVELSAGAGGAELTGYADRRGPARGVHDPLFARALVLEARDGERVAVCSLDLCYVGEDVVAAARARIARDAGIPPERVFVSATHTHSGPHDLDAGCWPEGLEAPIAEAVAQACAALRPARVGGGFGMVHGVALNRRRFEDPVDPALFVVRVDEPGGRPLALYCGFGCHPVVLGPDNRLVSGDWPGSCARILEERLATVALIGQGASGDVNPLTDGVRARLREDGAIAANAADTTYYGPRAERSRRIGNRAGGSFDEAERLGRTVAEEALRVRAGIEPVEVVGLATRAIAVPAAVPPDDRLPPPRHPIPPGHPARHRRLRPRVPPGTALEIMSVAIDGPGVRLVGQPGEVFAESGVRLRRRLRHGGVPLPFVVGCTNGWRGYLPPAEAFADGGYEVEWARCAGVPETVQATIEAALTRSAGWPANAP